MLKSPITTIERPRCPNCIERMALLRSWPSGSGLEVQTFECARCTIPAQLYQSFWQKVGIETEIRNIEGGPSYINPVLRGDYQIAFWEVADVPDPDFQVYQAFFSKSGGNITKINDPKLDEAIETGRRSLDINVRKQAYCDHRIRHYGLLANGNRPGNIAHARQLLAAPARPKQPETPEAALEQPRALPRACPCCGSRMIIIETFARGCEPKCRPTPPAAIRIDTS
jgi:hypothetical protein